MLGLLIYAATGTGLIGQGSRADITESTKGRFVDTDVSSMCEGASRSVRGAAE